MPTPRIVSVTIEHVWDDGTVTPFMVATRRDGELSPYVSLESEASVISLRHESWPEIRAQIDAMFAEVEE